MKIGVILESKVPSDKRTALTPRQCKEVEKLFEATVAVAPSPFRCFPDADYAAENVSFQTDLSDCDVLLGIKEVVKETLIPNKTYLFFSHTIKKQPQNRELLREILKKNIRMIDYETLTDQKGDRIIAFGRFAGIVGAYNGMRAYGRRYNLFDLTPAHQLLDLEAVWQEAKKIKLPPIKITLTGGGRVANGALEILKLLNIKQMSPQEFLETTQINEAVFTQLNPEDHHLRKDGKPFVLNDFFANPQDYSGDFEKYYQQTDLLMTAAFWHPASPVLFSKTDMKQDDFKIKVIADISCDINGAVASTIRPCLITDPFYDYNPQTQSEEKPFSSDTNITMMAIDNLPGELPRDASTEFGKRLIETILPCFFGNDPEKVLERATITQNGKLTEKFSYLQDYVDGTNEI